MIRADGRLPDQLRPTTFVPDVAPSATGSVLCAYGNTHVICTVMVEEGVPRWMKEQGIHGGWLTAEYSMLPASTHSRKNRDISRGKLDGRSSEIQRLIGRSLRAVVDLSLVGQRTIWVDCDVLQADGGTRTAAITGSCVALSMAFDRMLQQKKIIRSPLTGLVAGVSAGIWQKETILDLNYIEDRDASVDFNFVLTEHGEFVEVQGAGEQATFTDSQFAELMALGKKGISELCRRQSEAIRATRPEATGDQLQALAGFFSKR